MHFMLPIVHVLVTDVVCALYSSYCMCFDYKHVFQVRISDTCANNSLTIYMTAEFLVDFECLTREFNCVPDIQFLKPYQDATHMLVRD